MRAAAAGARDFAGRRGAVVPAAEPRVRADGLVRVPVLAASRSSSPNRSTPSRAISCTRAADGPHRRAARLREAARADHRRRRRRPAAPKAAIFRLGGERRPGAGAGACCAARSAGPITSLKTALGERLVFSTVREQARRTAAFRRLRQRPARRQRDGVLPRHRHSDHRRLRPDRDRADPDVQSAARAARRHRRAADSRASSCGSPTTARFSRADRTSCAATSTSPRRPPTS